MSSSLRSVPSSLPERLRVVLEMRESNHSCPPDVAKALANLAYFRKETKPAVAPTPTSRFANLDRRPDDWRSNHAHHDRRSAKTEDGFEVWNGNRRRPQPARFESRAKPEATRTEAPRTEAPRTESPHSETPRSETASGTEPVVARFSSAAVKTSVTVEDRMLARIKGKINKIGASTYEATKVFMQQILDSDETGFLDEFMKFVFQKAATESTFCSLYARLLHELADEFTHLRTVMTSLFRDYIGIFKEVVDTADVGTSDYRGFVEAQERKKFRRGYSQFVAELVKLGEADKEDFATLIHTIVDVIEANHSDASKTLLCEEYIDCLANLCKGASNLLKVSKWAEGIHQRLNILTKKPRAEVPGLTNKGRFALMDLVDFASRGWK